MKRIFLVLLLLVSYFSEAQTGKSYYGKVGINVGTVEPAERLKVNGDSWITGNLKLGNIANVVDSLNNKVNKVTGKGLSTNDYTTTEKNKLSGIASGATANSTDAQLRNRSTHTGTQAISTVSNLQDSLNIKQVKEVPVFIFIGESNAEGRALNSSATALELSIRDNVKIWNVDSTKFQSLDVGTNNIWNNNALFQANKTLWHGWELEIANRTADRIGYRTVFVIKTAQGGSMIGDWWLTSSPNFVEFKSRVNNAFSAIRALGYIPKPYIFQSIGINDAISGTGETSFSNGLNGLHTNIRNFLGSATPIIMTQIMENNASYITINNAIKNFSAKNTYNVSVSGLSLVDANHWDYTGMKVLCNRLLDVAVDVVGLPNNTTGRAISGVNNSFETISGNAITKADVTKVIVRPIVSATDWQLAPLRIEGFSNVNKFGYNFYDTANNRLVIGAVTAGSSNDNVYIAPLASTIVNNLNILGLTTAAQINATLGNFQLSANNGNDQTSSIVRFGNNTNLNSYGYISHDASDQTTYFGSVNSGVAHTNLVSAFLGTSKFGVGRKPTTNKFEVTGNSFFDGSVGVGNINPASSAIIDAASTSKGILIPRMTATERNAIASKANWLMIICTDCTATDGSTGVQQTWTGSVWKNAW